MPFNLDTYDHTGRDLEVHAMHEHGTRHTTEITIRAFDPIDQAVVMSRVMQAINNLGADIEVTVDVTSTTHSHLDNLDF